MLDGLVQDTRYALRTLRASAGYTVVSVLSLGLAIGAVTTMFSAVAAVDFASLPYRDLDRLVSIKMVALPGRHDFEAGFRVSFSVPKFIALRQRARSYEWLEGAGYMVLDFDDGESILATVATPGFLQMLGASPALGRLFVTFDSAVDAPPVIVLSHELWQSRFGGDSTVIGKRITMIQPTSQNQAVVYTIVGVAQPGLRFSAATTTRAWVPIRADVLAKLVGRTVIETVGKLRPGSSVSVADAEVRALVRQMDAEDPSRRGWTGSVEPLQAALVTDNRVGHDRYRLFGIAAFVLLLAVINLANLNLSRSTVRRAEFAIRAAIGATWRRLAQQVLVESGCVVVAGGLLGLIVALFGVRVAAARLNFGQVALAPHVDPLTLGFALVVAMASGILVGLAPLAALARADLVSTAKAGGLGGATRRSPVGQRALIAMGIGFALVLLTGAGLFAKDFWRVSDMGFEPRNLYANVLGNFRSGMSPLAAREELRQTVLRVRAIRGVDRASGRATRNIAHLGDRQDPSRMIRHDPAVGDFVDIEGVSSDYFETLRMPLVRGRYFAGADTLTPAAVVSAVVAGRLWPGENPIGREIVYGDSTFQTVATVIGVVSGQSLRGHSDYQAYVPLGVINSPSSTVVYRVRGSDAATMKAVRRTIAEVTGLSLARTAPYDYWRVYGSYLELPRFNTVALLVFATFGLLLAAMGIYGVVSFTVGSRTREIGVRIALGAPSNSILTLVARETLLFAAIGTVLGVLGAVGLTRFIKSLINVTSVTDPAVFITAVVLLALVAIVAALVPAWHAVRIDPVSALRAE